MLINPPPGEYFDRVAYQVDEYLLDSQRVARHLHGLVGHDEVNLVLLGGGTVQIGHVGDERAKVDRLEAKLELARLDARGVEQIAHEPVESVHLPLHQPKHLGARLQRRRLRATPQSGGSQLERRSGPRKSWATVARNVSRSRCWRDTPLASSLNVTAICWISAAPPGGARDASSPAANCPMARLSAIIGRSNSRSEPIITPPKPIRSKPATMPPVTSATEDKRRAVSSSEVANFSSAATRCCRSAKANWRAGVARSTISSNGKSLGLEALPQIDVILALANEVVELSRPISRGESPRFIDVGSELGLGVGLLRKRLGGASSRRQMLSRANQSKAPSARSEERIRASASPTSVVS